MARAPKLLAFVLVLVAALLVGAGRGSGSSLPTLYFSYDSSCHLTASLDNGTAVTAAEPIPYGTYQVIVTTPFPFANDQGSCYSVNFKLSGPGVGFTTTLAGGDATQETIPVSFLPNSTYTVTDASMGAGVTLALSTSGTQVQGVAAPAAPAQAPTITAFTPSSGKVGTKVTITGGGLTGATSVKLGSVTMPFTVVSQTKITATVPSKAKTGAITIKSAGGKATSTKSFVVKT